MKFIDIGGDSLDVSGKEAQSYVNTLSSNTGAPYSLTPGGKVVEEPGPPVPGSSESLRAEASNIISSTTTNVSVVAIAANDRVLFDADARRPEAQKLGLAGTVDMGDFSAISGAPELQAALMGHILKERATSGSLANAHKQALVTETNIMNELMGTRAKTRTTPFDDYTSIDYQRKKGPVGSSYIWHAFDYGTHSYWLHTPNKNNTNIVNHVWRTK